jgi:hypothetical protein
MALRAGGLTGLMNQPSAQVIDGSLKFDKDKSQRLEFTPSVSGNRRTWTISYWYKNNNFGNTGRQFQAGTSDPDFFLLGYHSDGYIQCTEWSTNWFRTGALLRDTGWYHIVLAWDSTQSTNTERWKFYINGVLQTAWTDSGSHLNYPSQNDEDAVNKASVVHQLGSNTANSQYTDGAMAQVYFIDGQQLDASHFGFTDPLTNTWRPKKYTGGFNNPNNGTTWSSTTNGNFWSAISRGADKAFNGIFNGTDYAQATTGNTATVSGLGITGINKIRVNIAKNGGSDNWGTFALDSTDLTSWLQSNYPSVSNSGTWIDVTSQFTSSTLGSISITTNNASTDVRLAAVEINDFVLLDGADDNSFHLPFDGSAPIGQDKSGNGNDFTPVNFGGSNSIEKATGAKPILNTGNGGNIARPGVFGSEVSKYYTILGTSGGGNPYVFEDLGNQPQLSFIRGATYTFDWSAASSHPLRFATAADAAGGTEYTDGTDVTGNVTSITVPHDAPDTLYYYCNVHGGMGNSISVTTDETKADPYAWKNVLALPLVGSASDVSASIACTSTTNSITNSGVDFVSTYSNFYGGSADFTGASTDVLYTASDNTKYQMGTGNFTVECWVYSTTSSGTQNIFQVFKSSGSKYYGVYYSSTLSFQIAGSGGVTVNVGNIVMGNNKWTHIAMVRDGGTLRAFVDGVQVGSGSVSADINEDGYVAYVGRHQPSNNGFTGYMQDFRIYKGVAKYTSNFIPASTNPDILPDTPSGVATKTALTKITDGAVSFDGTNDYLTIADSDDFNLGSGAFTIEGFCYLNNSNAQQFLVGQWTDSQLSYVVQTTNDSNRNLRFLISNDGSTVNFDKGGSGLSLKLKGWSHFAVTRSGNTFYLFVDGILVGTQSGSQTLHNSTGTLAIGARNDGTQDLNGFISNVRIVKGTALYTSNFTPPTRELTDVTNTKLLCCQSNSEGPQKTAVIPSVTGTATAMWPLDSDINDDSGNSNNLSENGGSTSFTSAASNSFGITNAANFAKDGKYLSYAVTPASAWTIDGYIRLETTTTSAPYILGWNGTDGNDTCLGFSSDGSRKFGVFGSSNLNTDVVAEIGRWYHVRITTNGTTDLALYVDGVLAGRSTSSDGGPASPITIGDMQSGRFSGQIAGVRYTPTDLGAPPLGGETTSSGVTSNSPSVGVGLAGDVAATNFNPFITDINTFRGQETGYSTFNPLQKNSGVTLSNGNLKLQTTTNAWKATQTTIGMKTGKFYWEFGPKLWKDNNNHCQPGVAAVGLGNAYEMGATNYTAFYHYTGTKFFNGQGGAGTAFGAAWNDSEDNIIGIAFDADTRKVWFSRNGVWQGGGNPNVGTNEAGIINLYGDGTYSPTLGSYGSLNGGGADANFGQKPFRYTPPDGFQPLSASTVRPDTVVPRPDQYVGVTTYTGNGASTPGGSGGTQTIDVGHKPDLIWIKDRTQAHNNNLLDTIRGVNSILMSDTSDTSVTNSSDAVTAFTDNGFTLGDNGEGTQSLELNKNGNNYVAWTWKAGGEPTATNTQSSGAMTANSVSVDGVLQSAYTPSGSPTIYPKKMSVGTKQGFSMVQYVGNDTLGATLPHGLTKAPDFFVTKADYDNREWQAYHKSLGNQQPIRLNTNQAAQAAHVSYFNNTSPTASVVTFGNGGDANQGGETPLTYVMYAWHDVPGLQKFGIYEGNNNADGPFIELGFRPSIIWLKNIDATGNWIIYDNERDKFNGATKILLADTNGGGNANDAFVGSYPTDFLSNGFKIRNATGEINGSNTYIYCAWAEAPTFNLYGATSNAR